MSHVDSKDDEVKSILAEINSDDSKESNKDDKKEHEKQPYQISSDTIEWEENTEESPDSEW